MYVLIPHHLTHLAELVPVTLPQQSLNLPSTTIPPLPQTELAHKRTSVYLIYFHLCVTLLAFLFPLQKQLFFLLLCPGLVSVMFLYHNPDWGLGSIKLLNHQRHFLVTVHAGELIVNLYTYCYFELSEVILTFTTLVWAIPPFYWTVSLLHWR